MSAIITNQFRKNSRELFINDIDTNTNYFIGIGKSEPWPDVSGVEESALNYSVPLPTNTTVESNDVLQNLISLLKVENTYAVIPRNEWVSNRVYKVYDPTDPNVFNYETQGPTAYYPCYATHDNHIYVCLRNGDNGESTEAFPANTSTYHNPNTYTADGYAWAYVCDLPVNSNFNTDQFVDIPADLDPSTQLTEIVNAYNNTGGLVYGFKVIDGGALLTATNSFDDITLIGKKSDGTIIENDPIRENGTNTTPFEVIISNNTITAINIIASWPLEYAEASVVVNGVETNIIPLIAPVKGFGFSPRSDLPSFYAGLYGSYAGAEGGETPVNIGFRQVSLVKGATRTDNDNLPDSTLNIYDTLQYLEVTSDVSGIPTDAGTIISHASNKAKAYLDYIDSNSTPNRIYYHQNSSGEVNQKPFETGNVLFAIPGGTPGNQAGVTGLGQGEYNQGSGKTLFLENRKAILRNNNQQEDIKLVIQF